MEKGMAIHTISQSLLKLMFIELVMPSNHLILCPPLFLLPSIFPRIWVFSNESALLIRWPKFWIFSLRISPSNEYSGLISFRNDWLDLFAVQGTLKSLLQHHSSKALILRHSASLQSNSHIHGLPMWLSWYKIHLQCRICVRSLGWEEPLEKGKATHSSIQAWRIPWTVQSMGSQRVGPN